MGRSHLSNYSYYKREQGIQGESAAVAYLIRQGCQILDRNYRCKYGEIDIIAIDQNYLIIVEVKHRMDARTGNPAEAVNRAKQRKIIRTFNHYRMTQQITDDTPVRFDVITLINNTQIQWIKNAFEYFE